MGPTRHPSASAPVAAALIACCACGWGACVSSPTSDDGASVVVPVTLPQWLHAPSGVERDARLEEAAALLCARDTDGVIDTDARHATGLWDGVVLGLLRKGASAREQLARDAGPLLAGLRANRAGVVEGVTPAGEACAALVATRRLLALKDAPAGRLPAGAPQSLTVSVDARWDATLFVLKPSGFVDKVPVRSGGTVLSVPSREGEGRYVLELLVDDPHTHDPQVALWWPYLVGAPREPPFPEVLFPDEGHDDTALTHRAEALVQRLRNEQLIEPLKISPLLLGVASERAQGISQSGHLGHRVPGGTDVITMLRSRFPDDARANFARVAEVQAQGSTLADAWQALLDSPAHRYELVDTGFTHTGVAVARGFDAAHRPLVSLVAILARRAPSRDVAVVRTQLLDIINAAREERGLDTLAPSAHLDRIAMRLADRMRETRTVDETLLGGPVGQVALEADASLALVKPLVSRLDDPLLLVQGKLPPLLLELDAKQLGFGMALDAATGVFYVCLLSGE